MENIRKKKVYISGKITGDTLYKAKFKTVAENLNAEGYEVINPAETVLPNSKLATWEDYMLVSFAFLNKADEIYIYAQRLEAITRSVCRIWLCDSKRYEDKI